MIRHYYITEDLNVLETVEQDLRKRGFTDPQLHVLSEDDASVEKHHLHAIESVLKKDVVHSTEMGAVIGVIGASLVLLCAYLMEWYNTPVGWVPFGFLAIIVLGFCTWEGGLIGIQIPNHQFKRFQSLLKEGKHVFFVDVSHEQMQSLDEVVCGQPLMQLAGTGEATPTWVVRGQDKFNQFMKTMP